MTIENVRAAYTLADRIDISEGRQAYPRYQIVMRNLGDYYGFDLETTTAVFCTLSPNSDYIGNLRSAATLLKAKREGVPLERAVVTTYRHMAKRAWRYLNGERFLDVAKGLKIRSFYQNIIDPLDPVPVTIDGHMISVWVGKRLLMKQAVYSRDYRRYQEIAEAIRVVAGEEGLRANQLQSILWFTWKRVHNVIFDPQMSLLNQGDHWRLFRDPAEIIPFPFLTGGRAKAIQDEFYFSPQMDLF